MGFQDAITDFIANSPVADALYLDTVTFQTERTYANVTGLVDLRARVMSVGSGRNSESAEWAVNLGATHTVQLKGHYPAVSTSMRVLWGEKVLLIVPEGVKHPDGALTVVACKDTEA